MIESVGIKAQLVIDIICECGKVTSVVTDGGNVVAAIKEFTCSSCREEGEYYFTTEEAPNDN